MKILWALLVLSGVALLGAGAFACVRIGMLATDLSQTAIDASTAILEARATVESVRTETHDALSRALDQVAGLRVDAISEIHSIRQTEIPYILRETDLKLNRALLLAELSGTRLDGQLAALNRNIAAVLDPAAATLRRVDESSSILLDCKGNGACLPAQTLALVGSARYTMGQVARAAPEASRAFLGIEKSIQASAAVIERGVPQFVQNSNGITRSVDQILRPRWWETPLKAAVAGAVVAGSLK